MIGSCQTVPVNQLSGTRRDGTDPHALMSIRSSSVSSVILGRKTDGGEEHAGANNPPHAEVLREAEPRSTHDGWSRRLLDDPSRLGATRLAHQDEVCGRDCGMPTRCYG